MFSDTWNRSFLRSTITTPFSVNTIEIGVTGRKDRIGEDSGVKARLRARRNPVFCELEEISMLAVEKTNLLVMRVNIYLCSR
jgi:hypothetical protein